MTSPAWKPPEPNFDHLMHMTDARGTFEHAMFGDPRPEHGYCADDMSRVLVVSSRESGDSPAVRCLMALSVGFIDDAIDSQGKCRNRMNRLGEWEDRPALDDCWGRAIWGLGSAIARSGDGGVRRRAIEILGRACAQRSAWPRSMAFAALGAAEVLTCVPEHVGARALLAAAADMMDGLGAGCNGADWVWPEPRLTYANAAVPEAMIAAGWMLDRPRLLDRGLALLEWLLDRESLDGHLSVTPAGGAGPTDGKARFDQQPIEVAAMADACARAASVDGAQRWPDGVRSAVAWFMGDNDCGVVMWDEATHGGFDGLELGGANRNQGAESTLALLSTLQHARTFALVGQ